jgi:hypothetical protein
MLDDLEVGDALNGVKKIELKPVFALMKIKDDIMAERSIARSEYPSSTKTENVMTASAAETIVCAPCILCHYRAVAIQDIVPRAPF